MLFIGQTIEVKSFIYRFLQLFSQPQQNLQSAQRPCLGLYSAKVERIVENMGET